MSDSWIDWKPLIDEPSKAMPAASESTDTVAGRHGEVVHDAGQVAEPDVEDLDIVVRDVGDQALRGWRTRTRSLSSVDNRGRLTDGDRVVDRRVHWCAD